MEDLRVAVEDPHVQRAALLHGVVTGEHARNGVGHARPFGLRQEAHTTQVDTDERHIGSVQRFGCAQNGAVSAENDGALEVGKTHGLAEDGQVAEVGRGGGHGIVLDVAKHRCHTGVTQVMAHLNARLEGIGLCGVRHHQDVADLAHV